MDDSASTKVILAASPEDWRRLAGRPRITWLKTVLDSLKLHILTLSKAIVMAQIDRCGDCWLRVALCTLCGTNSEMMMMMMMMMMISHDD